MISVSVRFPRSWKCDGRKTAFIGWRCDSQALARTVKASPLIVHEATKINPKIVDDHEGSRDITQSIAANVTVIMKMPSPGPLIMRICLPHFGSAVRSCLSDSQLSNNANTDQSAK